MRTITIGDVRVLLPGLNPDDLDPTTDLADSLVEGTAWHGAQIPDVGIPSSLIIGVDLNGLELDSCHLDGADLRDNRLHGLKTPLDNLRGVTLGEDQLADLTRLIVAALDLTVRRD
ncbi:hypothetical protein [Micromonospora auratinigra]|uniref:Pentapeptide repeat-containing protein n=1 Tax=Micromonospora auratinigra TaxID=261654 RepID=A0A1A8ZHG4_9ACTN|nr:hypothetical protein [Micromonospora auratinigra]SBT43316.1 hypothetical protein GA0070611_2278 [Micromonospora auratinigra]